MKILRFTWALGFVFLAGLALVGCSGVRAASTDSASRAGSAGSFITPTEAVSGLSIPLDLTGSGGESEPSPGARADIDENDSTWPDGQSRRDDQGAVEVEVRPVNLNANSETLDFEVGLDTHSVDLGMDLAELATLTTAAGQAVRASAWDAPRGGHHVSGMLSFPAKVEGTSILDGVSKITLIVVDLDAPERVFVWER